MAIAFVNQATGTNDAAATSLAAAAASHTTGNLVVVGVVWSNNVNATVPTDTAGNTYVSTGVKVSHGTTDFIEIFYAKNVTGNAANVVTAHYSASAAFRRIIVLQYSGADTTAPFDVGGTNTNAAGTAVTATCTGPTAQADEAQCSFAAAGNIETWSCTSHTMRSTSLGTDTGAGDRILTSTATYAAAFSCGTSAALWAATATFKAATGGTTPVTVTPSPSTVVFSSAATATAETAVAPASATAVFSAAATVSTAAPVDLGVVSAAAVFAAAATPTATTVVVPSPANAVFSAAGAVTASPVVAGSATASFTASAAAVAPTVVVPAAATSVFGASAVVTTPGTPIASSRLPLVGVGT